MERVQVVSFIYSFIGAILCNILPLALIGLIIYLLTRKRHDVIPKYPWVAVRIYAYTMLYILLFVWVIGLILTTRATLSMIPKIDRLFYEVRLSSDEMEEITEKCVDKYNCKPYEVARYNEGKCGECFRDEYNKVGKVDKNKVIDDLTLGISLLSVGLLFYGLHYIAVRLFEKGFNRELTLTRKAYLFSGVITYAPIAVILLVISISGILDKLLEPNKDVVVNVGVWVVSAIFVLLVWIYFFIALLQNMRTGNMKNKPSEDSSAFLSQGHVI